MDELKLIIPKEPEPKHDEPAQVFTKIIELKISDESKQEKE